MVCNTLEAGGALYFKYLPERCGSMFWRGFSARRVRCQLARELGSKSMVLFLLCSLQVAACRCQGC